MSFNSEGPTRASPDIGQKVITTHALKLKQSHPEASRALIKHIIIVGVKVAYPKRDENINFYFIFKSNFCQKRFDICNFKS